MDIEQYITARQERINGFLEKILTDNRNAVYSAYRKTVQNNSHLSEAMSYAVLNGGKRIRPLLIYATGEAFGVDLTLLDYPACAIELIHAFSLVHDDLPAMDNDDLRRGKPTCHKVYGEATGILTGDALQSLAFLVMTHCCHLTTASNVVNLVAELAEATGSMGMAGGQALDIEATNTQQDLGHLEAIHSLKTGALITACVRMALICANIQDDTTINAFQKFATTIGLCFQIQDDILDAEGQTDTLGKAARKDQTKQKATFTTHYGIDKAKEMLQDHYRLALTTLDPYGDQVYYLKKLAEFIINRSH